MSIMTVAERAGVSKSTVSLVINNSPLVFGATAEKVRRTMLEMGYAPPPRDRRRGPKQSSTEPKVANIALLTIGIDSAVLRAPIYADVLHGINCTLSSSSHRLTVYNRPAGEQSLPPELLRAGIDGFLIFGRPETPALRKALREYPCVALMGVDAPRRWCDWVGFDDRQVGQIAAEYLLQRGHRHCAYIGFERWARATSFSAVAQAAGATVSQLSAENLVVANDNIHETNTVELDALLDRFEALSPRPTGLFVWADILTAALYPRLYARGIVPGRDIEVISCNNEWPLLLGLQPKPAIVDVQGMKIGQRAVEQLLWRISHKAEPSVWTMLMPSLIAPPESKLEGVL